jgi:acyl transferase domain-containing protein
MGGTNAHVVLEEFDVRLRQTVSDVRLRQTVSPVVPQRRPQLLVLSAGSPAALGAAMTRLADHLPVHPKASLASVAWTLQTGRRQLPYRGYAVVNGIGDAGEVLAGRDPVRLVTSENPARTRSVTFVFSETTRAGGGMAEPIFRNVIEECRDAAGAPAEELAGLAWQCALAQMWARWGVTPDAVLGIGAGVLAAAVVSGALPLRVAARWAAERPAGRTFTGLGLGTARIPLLVADDPGGVGAALSKLVDDPARVFLRIGDGPAFGHAGKPLVIPGAGDEWSLLSAAGRLWQTGVDIAWEAVHDGLVPVRTVLPAYPFERQRYVVEPVASSPGEQTPERLAAADARQVVAGLFGEMLGLGPDDLDRDESFFDLGGDSLVATKILVAIRKIYPIELALRSMFEAPTVNTFAALVEERLAEQTGGVRGSAD